jgi:hypothetical protein
MSDTFDDDDKLSDPSDAGERPSDGSVEAGVAEDDEDSGPAPGVMEWGEHGEIGWFQGIALHLDFGAK